MSWHFKYPLCWNVLNAQNCSVKRESWWWWGCSWWWWEGWGLYSRNKEFLSQNNGLKQTLHGRGLFDGMFLVWCLHAFICCLRCLGELQTVRTCGSYVNYMFWVFFFSLFKTGHSLHDTRRIKKEEIRNSGSVRQAYTQLFLISLFPINWSAGISSGVKRWLINVLQSLWCASPGHLKASHFTCMYAWVCAPLKTPQTNHTYFCM